MSASLPPPAPRDLALEPARAIAALVALTRSRALLAAAPRGDGQPVIVLPGLFNGDAAMIVMRRFLARIGHRALGWGLGPNLGLRTIGPAGERLFDRIDAVAAEHGPVALVGVSLGGIMARIAAHRRPDAVRAVVTVAAPYAGDPRATNVWRLFEWASGQRVDSPATAAWLAEAARPLAVPATAIWSARDGIVNGLICHCPDEPGCRAVEVTASHLGVQHQPDVLLRIAEALAPPPPPPPPGPGPGPA